VLRQLLAWERDLVGRRGKGLFDDRIYVLTPEAAVSSCRGRHAGGLCLRVHTDLGHRCRGARVDGAMVPLNTPLQNGQTVEVTAAKEGGPSRDWLNAELGYLTSHAARAKVRAWFNAQAMHETVARGREAVEKLLQREGKTAIKLDDLAASWASSRPMRCSRWSARTSSRCATSKPAAPARAGAGDDDYLLLKARASRSRRPRAACWWWASIR
jgi:GTP pyrophosphokinase